MAASRSDIKQWFEEGVTRGATHMIVVCDNWDHEDFPSYVSSKEELEAKERKLAENSMLRIMEIYSMSQNMEAQLNEEQALHRD